MTITEAKKLVFELAKNMASYAHSAGYPVFDGGHSEPENECRHPNCIAIRVFEKEVM